MRVFVAGATGAIGRPLVDQLVRAGHQVTGTSRTAEGVASLRASGADAVRLNIFDAEDVAGSTVAALEWPSGTVNIVDDEPAPGREWVPVLAAAVGAPAPAPVPGRAAWERGAANTLARGLGWQPKYPSWRTGFTA
ncbi:NAD(P)H-binding protein [Nocardia huaxiensis]|uniref:NAD(P)H-binding protein n=1 Tax=Nocardia huaxiensis TaxID=2755382 RepID=A0A7D6VB58_9NOCA|nr:NAD(P)H-binding protein [Nocardia huaxiensis]QLY28657.1 NAD(P)H-binding protein [Nocardia huaxiensis]UFS97872.1 NAD(P)H-binding protein [Nocardia huaxiensis]